MHAWAGLKEVKIALNKDFLPSKMTPQEIQAITALWMSNGISSNTLFYNLQQGEIIPEGITFEDEQAQISEQSPPAGLINAG